MRCPACGEPNPPEASSCRGCGAGLSSQEQGPRVVRGGPPADQAGDEGAYEPRRRRTHHAGDDSGALSTLIPYHNPRALASYYLGVLALIPVLGVLLAIAAIILGILGLQYRSAYPEAKGTAHAILGIVLGIASLFFCQPLYGIFYWLLRH